MQNLAVVKSLDARNHISLDELSACTRHIAERMKAIGKPLPPVLILHVSESVAAAWGVGSAGVIRRSRFASTSRRNYYELWVVGNVSVADYVLALESILQDHFAR